MFLSGSFLLIIILLGHFSILKIEYRTSYAQISFINLIVLIVTLGISALQVEILKYAYVSIGEFLLEPIE